MSSIVIKHSRIADKDVASLVHRRHDLSGTDYEPLTELPFDVAVILGRNGIVVTQEHASNHERKAGIVFSPAQQQDMMIMDIRMDVSQPISTTSRLFINKSIAYEITGDTPVSQLQWLTGEPALKLAA